MRLNSSLIGPLVPSDDFTPDSPSPARLLDLTARIVSAHAGHNPVAPGQLPELIRAVHRTLNGLGQGGAAMAEPARPDPAVPIRRSVAPDRITCLECGAKMTMLKRHLGTEHGLTPEGYRERWRLGRDYPMVAPRYAEVRSGLAKQFGLGRKRDEQAEAEIPPESPVAVETKPAAAATKGRKRGAQPPVPASGSEAPGAPVPARGRGRRRAKDAGAA